MNNSLFKEKEKLNFNRIDYVGTGNMSPKELFQKLKIENHKMWFLTYAQDVNNRIINLLFTEQTKEKKIV